MSQTYTADCYASGHTGATDLQAYEDNFAALKSAFSGTDEPSNTVAGMWWFDTTANILKLRNEANDAWQSVWDFANNKPVITNLSAEITDTMVATANKDGAAGTACMRTLGTAALTACAGNDARLGTRVKIGTITRGMSSDSGDVSYTGVGFKPTNILFLAQVASASISTGMDDGTNRYALTTWGTTPTYSTSSVLSISMIEDGTKMQTGIVKTLDADGFTITWKRTGTPAIANGTIFYMAFL